MAKYTIEVVSDHVCDLGEGPHWDEETQTLYYLDLLKGDILKLDPKTGVQEVLALGQTSPTSIIIPINKKKNEFIVTQMNKLYKLDWKSKQRTELSSIADKVGAENGFNDGKCDSSGRLWIGILGTFDNLDLAGSLEEVDMSKMKLKSAGALYSYDSVSFVKRFDGVGATNGMAWSLDEKHMYFIDTYKRVIHSFDFDIKTGNIENQSILFDFKKSDEFKSNVAPDGMTIDRSGNLWVACFNSGKVAQICTKTGRLIDSVKLPTSCVTSVCFGGQQLNELYVTTASKTLAEQRRAEQPNAGKLFRITSDSQSFGGYKANYGFNA